MNIRNLIAYAALGIGGIMVVGGAAFAVMYVTEAVVGTMGEGDRSLLFWYLPILFIGLIGTGLGFSVCQWGLKRLRHSGFNPGSKGSIEE